MVYWLALLLVFLKSQLRISVLKPANLTDVCRVVISEKRFDCTERFVT
jgi:hypothetical protein